MIERINNTIFKWLGMFLILITSFLVGIIFLQVVLRFVFNFSIAEIDELSRYLFVWVIFLGISYGFREKAHLGVVFFVGLLPPKIKKAFLVGIELLVTIFFVVVVVTGYKMVLFTMAQRSATLLIPMGYVYLAIPAGAIFCILAMLERLNLSANS